MDGSQSLCFLFHFKSLVQGASPPPSCISWTPKNPPMLSTMCLHELQLLNHLPSQRQESTEHLSPMSFQLKEAVLLAEKLWDSFEVFLNLKRPCRHPCLSLPHPPRLSQPVVGDRRTELAPC